MLFLNKNTDPNHHSFTGIGVSTRSGSPGCIMLFWSEGWCVKKKGEGSWVNKEGCGLKTGWGLERKGCGSEKKVVGQNRRVVGFGKKGIPLKSYILWGVRPFCWQFCLFTCIPISMSINQSTSARKASQKMPQSWKTTEGPYQDPPVGVSWLNYPTLPA